MRTQTSFIFSVGALALLAAPAHADRGRNPLEGQPAIRHRVELRKLRLEFTPQVLVSINQPYLIGVGGGAALQFHLTDWLGLGASFHYTQNLEAPLVGRITEALPDSYAGTSDPSSGLKQPSKQMFKDHLIGPQMLVGIYGTLTPIAGKFSLFNTLFAPLTSNPAAYTDSSSISRSTNATALTTANDVNLQTPDPFTGLRPAGLFGIGVHMFFNHFVGLNLELRDYLYKSNPGGLDVSTTDNNTDNSPVLSGADEYIVSHLYFGIGLTIMIPPGAKISR